MSQGASRLRRLAPALLCLWCLWWWPVPAGATKPCPLGTAPSLAWQLLPWGIVTCSVLLGWLAARLIPGLWGKLICVLVIAFGLGLGFLLMILPGPCVQ